VNSGPEGLWLSATCAVCKRRATVSFNEHVDKEIVPTEPIAAIFVATPARGNRTRYRDLGILFCYRLRRHMARLSLGDRLRAVLIFRLLLRLFIKNDAVVRVFHHGMGASVSFAGCRMHPLPRPTLRTDVRSAVEAPAMSSIHSCGQRRPTV
jgi:hypothetical protein